MGKIKCIQYKTINEDVNHDEMTRGDFESHVKAYLKKLITTPSHADVSDYLKNHDITSEKLKKMLKDSGILVQHESITTNKDSGKDEYKIKYNIVRKDFNKRLRNIYIENFESNIINECDCGNGGCDASMVGQFSAPVGLVKKKIGEKHLILNQEQADYLKEAFAGGNFPTYDVPMATDKKDPTLNHENICTGDEPVGHDGR